MDTYEIPDKYQIRIKIGFLYQNGKQFAVLTDSMAHNKNKLNFHFNSVLTAINVVKEKDWLNKPKESCKLF